MTALPWAASIAALLLAAVVLRQPMVGLLLAGSASVALALNRALRGLPWAVLALKLGLLAAVSVLVPMVWPDGGGLIPVNPDQHLYMETSGRIAEALRVSPLSVDYATIVGLHNRSYSVALGWLGFLNGGGNVFLYRLFNVFLSMVLAGLSYALARSVCPRSRRVPMLVFLGVAFLPSANVYSMFVLRDVLIAAVVMSVALGLFGHTLWLVLAGLAVAYFTRLQLFFLLAGAVALFVSMRVARRAGPYSPALKWVLAAGFVVAGFYLAPLVLPPEYDYTHASSVSSFGQFLVRLVPSLLGLDFGFAVQGSLELDRATLAAARIVLVDTWLVPLLFLGAAVCYRKMTESCREFYLWVGAVSVGYAAGYWITYGVVFVRLLMPLYPLFLLAAAGGLLRSTDHGAATGESVGQTPGSDLHS